MHHIDGDATVNSPFPLVAEFGESLTPVAPLHLLAGGFSGAHVWKAECRQGVFAVRRWPEETDVERLRALHRLLRHIASDAVPVAVPLKNELGVSLVFHAGHWWQVEPWLPGQADFRESPSDEKLAAAMTALARFHLAATSFVPSHEDATWFGGPETGLAPTVQDRVELARHRLIGSEIEMIRRSVPLQSGTEFDDLARRLLRVVERKGERVFDELRSAESFLVPLIPCLRDVWHDHVLFTGDVVTGLVDPAACRRDTVAADLSRLLGSLLRDDRPRWDYALRCYQQHRPLTAGELQLVPVLDRSGVLLSAITWLRRKYLLSQDCESPAIVNRLRATVERSETLR